jgi:hypothetical protein
MREVNLSRRLRAFIAKFCGDSTRDARGILQIFFVGFTYLAVGARGF